MEILDGKKIATQVKDEIRLEVEQIKAEGGKVPHLAAILVGTDGASETYVANKVRSCEYVGFKSTLIRKPDSISEKELLEVVNELNHDPDVDGFIVQSPLPAHIEEQKVILAIDPGKDVDGFHPTNVGRMVLGLPAYVSATPYGIIKLLEKYNVETTGKHCVVVGRSNIVGTPMSILMSRNNKYANCTVTLCHSRTRDIQSITRQADILIVALGKPEFITADMVKEGAIVIDVGITRVADASAKKGYRLKGDVKFDEVASKCSFITPVPGGVGPMTVTALLGNTLKARRGHIVHS